MVVFHESVLLLAMNFLMYHPENGPRIHSAIAWWVYSFFDNVTTKFVINDI